MPDPNGQDVVAFAAKAKLQGSTDDPNADAWARASSDQGDQSIEGDWSSRWNGGVDPTIAGDATDKWKQGIGKVKIAEDRIYLFFDWDNGARKGLVDARRAGSNKLVGRYINLTAPEIRRPWVGLIVSNQRIDGQFPEGRLDFRR